MKRIALLAATALLCVGLAGCGANGAESANGQAGQEPQSQSAKAAAPAKDAIKIEDLDWSVDQTLIDGQRVIAFNYTNNSPYMICGIDIEFTQRTDVTEEQRSVFNEIYEDNDTWEEWNGGPEELYITASTERVVNPGESTDTAICTFNNTATMVDNMDQYALMEPSQITIGYVDDDKIYVEYYDFLSQKYSLDSQSGIPAVSWPDSELAALIPAVDGPVVVVSYDDEDYFSVRSCGIAKEMYDSYVAQCEERGFVADSYSGGNYFSAANEEGVDVDVSFNPLQETMSVSIDRN